MMPLVSIVTAVYNGENYLAECIESVLAQTYGNWDYVIVDNCSTDKTLEIAQAYAGRDKRIRVMRNRLHVGAIENHNIALSHISPDSKYCKVVCADDRIYPECIELMVQLAEQYPSVGIVGSYILRGGEIQHIGLPQTRSVFSGQEVCRLHLLEKTQVVGAPTSVLYRSDIVRARKEFFPGPLLSADVAACYRTLRNHDLGFVHKVLAFLRIHDEALSVGQANLRAFWLDRVVLFAQYGRNCLSEEEFAKEFSRVLDDYYYDVLASAVLKRYPKTFWNYHIGGLNEVGLEINHVKLMKSVIHRVCDLVFNPGERHRA